MEFKVYRRGKTVFIRYIFNREDLKFIKEKLGGRLSLHLISGFEYIYKLNFDDIEMAKQFAMWAHENCKQLPQLAILSPYFSLLVNSIRKELFAGKKEDMHNGQESYI